jgi:hypothetical protein
MRDEAKPWIALGCVGGPPSIIAGNLMIERALRGAQTQQ